MATDDLTDFIQANATGSKRFKPYYEHSKESDAITVRFKPDADYSKRLTDHVTVFLSIDTQELVGCRIKGISQLIEDLPNYITIDTGEGIELSVLMWSFRGGAEDEDTRETFNKLALAADGMKLQPT